MNKMTAFWVSAFLVLIGVPAHADVDVRPNPKGSKVVLDVGRLSADRARVPRATQKQVTTGRSSNKPIYTPVRTCKVDPVVGNYGCRTYEPAEEEDAPAGRELTEGDIVRAVQEIGLPSLAVRIEPGASTLVNARTNFFTDPQAFARSVDLLGFDIDLEARPVRYLWVHGDGTRTSTAKPGRPYPDLDVTHRYREPADVVRPRVDVTYRVRYRVDGGAWASLGQTLTATGPASDLEVNEAAPVLTAP